MTVGADRLGAFHALISAAARRGLPGGPCARSSRLIGGGTRERTFLVSVDGGRFVAKLPERGTGSTIGPATEREILERLSAAGLAPKPLGYDAQTGIVFSEYLLAARPWSAAEARDARNIARAAGLLRRMHAAAGALGTIELRPFDVPAFADAYCRGLPSRAPGRLERIVEETRRFAEVYDAIEEAPVVCHNDLTASNILDDSTLRLVDFEYAVRARPVVDLASLAAMNDFDADEKRALFASYYGSDPPCDVRTFDKIVRMQRLIAELWTSAREGQEK